MSIVEALAIGFCFGWLLEKAGLARYERIANIYRFRDLAVLKFLLSALVVGALGIRVSIALGLAISVPIPATFLLGNFAGGLIFGVGMALSGFCPGTIAAGIGEGRLDYLIAGSLGLLAGALAFGACYPHVFSFFARTAHPGMTLADWLGVDPWLTVVLMVEIVAFGFYWIERRAGAEPLAPKDATSSSKAAPSTVTKRAH
jgi:uncharacterized protein